MGTLVDALLADMRRKYLHAKECEGGMAAGDWLRGEPITARILEAWIPQVEQAAAHIERLEAQVTADTARLSHAACFFDVLGDIDILTEAVARAEARGRDEPVEADWADAVRTALDAALSAQRGGE